MKKNVTVKQMDLEFVKTHNDYECYALVYSKAFSEIQDGNTLGKIADDDNALEGLVKIKLNCKCVYRKCIARNGINDNEVALGYRTRQKLGLKNGGCEVLIMPTNWFCYLWNHYESVIKWPFRIAFVSLIITALGTIITFCNSL